MWINAQGEEFWVKYHFISDQGVKCMTQDEADAMCGKDNDYHRRDLYDAIERGEHPSWTLKVQIMPFEDAKTYRFNPFDLTKVWPHGDYPLQEVGRLTLDTNPVDFHTQIEQLAFEPNNQPPGLGLSPDKMLIARGFSYADAHRARLGVNYKQIPVNAPKAPVSSYTVAGAMRVTNSVDPVYAPNSKGGPQVPQGHVEQPPTWYVDGDIQRAAYTPHPEDSDEGQARTLMLEVWDDDMRDRFVENVSGHLAGGVGDDVLERAFEYWKSIDQGMGERVQARVVELTGKDHLAGSGKVLSQS
jgi:catalase